MSQPINRQNSIRNERPKARPSSVSIKWPTWQADRRSQLAFGGLLMLLAIGLTVAFCSYLLTGQADQSVLSKVTDAPLRESGTEMRNFLGILGAYIAHVFIFRWFGIAALGIPIILFLAGCKLAFNFELLPLSRTTKAVLFYMTWISALAGYIVLATDSVGQGSVWCGGIGYEVNVWLYNLIGWGGLAIIGFALFVFLVFFYGITKLPSISLPQRPVSASKAAYDSEDDDPEEEDEDDVKDFIDVKPASNGVPKPVPSPTPVPVAEVPAEPEPLNGHTTELKPEKVNGSGPPAKKPLTFTIADTTPIEPASESPQPVAEVFAGPTDEVDEDALKLHGLYDPTLDLPRYQFPTIDLLTEYPENKKAQVSAEELEANKDRIVDTLQNYGITIDSIKATIGPTVTLYEIIPAAGVRISKIKSLEDDIALSLAALGIRIIAPMPGQGTIGIEVPNKNREMVAMRSVMTTEKFTKSNFELPVVMGKTISNEIYVADLAKMPHLLMAGATGQGKSVGLNVLLTSLIYKKHPSQLKLILVDPKKVELTLFNKLERHFLAQLPDSDEPIITDTKKVVNTLNSLCIEMDNRYNLLKDAQCRNLKEYNAKFIQRRLNPEKGHKFLPYIVLVIDELADLMMTAGKEVEQPIARLAQLARAIGIHLVVATQRPSVNVITGLIKANFPARLSFKVTSKIDSRTILDTGGAEQLVGMGDMLFSSNSDIVRLQCPFVDTNEIEDICEFVGSQRGYDSAYNLPEFAGDESGSSEEKEIDLENRDPMFDEAARLVVNHQQGSTSLIQRRLKLGYNRAGRLIDQLEAAGIVGAFEGSKAREVLVQDIHTLEEILKNMN
ncbi:FtsK/SpoIIIE family DNA translocase [Larkinella humicola]|uniref:DNA translocase FtsK n=1 Tax=Larkinella humicola TaxID=2607654 RepID=A0A5N1JK30_9BACT|nr:DNA translocase FtsK [Larkinella humicola]KAA9355150.1 DNA translocase FtsK [Larkinella humicola]